MPADNNQVQRFADERVRPHCELARALYIRLKDDRSAIDDIYAYLAGQNDYSDQRIDGPPHLLSGNDILAFNTFAADFVAFVEANSQWPVVLKACVQPPL